MVFKDVTHRYTQSYHVIHVAKSWCVMVEHEEQGQCGGPQRPTAGSVEDRGAAGDLEKRPGNQFSTKVCL